MRRLFLAAPVLGALIALACGAGATASARPAGAAGGAVEIEMGNFFFKPETIRVKVGERVTLRLMNRTTVEHEFMAGRRPNPGEGGYAEDLFKGVEVAASGGKAERGHGGGFEFEVEPGKTGELTFTAPDRKGTYEIGCFVPGHYQAGMKGKLVVE